MGSDPLSSGSLPSVPTAFYAPTKNLRQIGRRRLWAESGNAIRGGGF